MCRSFDHFTANNKQLVYKISLIYAPGFRTVNPVTRSEMIYELNCGLFALFESSTKLDFLWLPNALRERNPSGRKRSGGLRLLTSQCTLTLTFWRLLSSRHTPVSRSPFIHAVRGRTVQTSTSGYELRLAVWGGAVALTNGCRFYALSALRTRLSTDIDWIYVLQVHRGVALSRSPQGHIHKQTAQSRVDPNPRTSLP